MNVEDFVFDLPEELIAALPAERRDASRLLVVPPDPEEPTIHRHFSDIRAYLRPGDVLVVNNSRVIPARLYATRFTGGRTEMLLLTPDPVEGHANCWRAMVKPAKKARPGDMLMVEEGVLTATVVAAHENGERTIAFHCAEDFQEVLARLGTMPLPPYILKRREHEARTMDTAQLAAFDRDRYQTVYAQREGSVAAPTAGLHFTQELLAELRAAGVHVVEVTLHVGAGTFVGMEPGTAVESHKMHEEHYHIPRETADAINAAKREGRRVISVGTTSTRTLESGWDRQAGLLPAGAGSTAMMIKPGYDWQVIDGLITNFHLPRSTLLLLVSAIIGRERLLDVYTEAIRERYRFFSYGDAMFLRLRR